MGGLAGAWLVGMAITGWRQVRASQHLPVPASMLAVTGLFVVLALASDVSPAARRPIMLLAWGLDIAGLLRLLGPANGLFGEVKTTIDTEAASVTTPATGTTQAPGTTTAGGRG